jgi:hypothetical protein
MNAAPLTPRERARLVGVLSRLESPFDGERAAAALLAARLVRSVGLTWEDIIAVDRPTAWVPYMRQPPGPQRRVQDVELCLRHLELLTPWEAQFVRGITGGALLSVKQLRTLGENVGKRRQAGAK